MFDKAQKEIFELLSRDSFARFRKTPAFVRYLAFWARVHGKRYAKAGKDAPPTPR
jgi:DNA gyrase inhibitor GyrI